MMLQNVPAHQVSHIGVRESESYLYTPMACDNDVRDGGVERDVKDCEQRNPESEPVYARFESNMCV
jgi:hypothetical protein